MNKFAFSDFNLEQEKTRLRKREISFKNNKKDRLCVDLLALGKANWLIRKLTGYSDARIRYRGMLAGIDRNSYRNNLVTAYTRLTVGIERTEQFQESMDNYLKKHCPEMWGIVNQSEAKKAAKEPTWT